MKLSYKKDKKVAAVFARGALFCTEDDAWLFDIRFNIDENKTKQKKNDSIGIRAGANGMSTVSFDITEDTRVLLYFFLLSALTFACYSLVTR